jgi:hypothetical protein
MLGEHPAHRVFTLKPRINYRMWIVGRFRAVQYVLAFDLARGNWYTLSARGLR